MAVRTCNWSQFINTQFKTPLKLNGRIGCVSLPCNFFMVPNQLIEIHNKFKLGQNQAPFMYL